MKNLILVLLGARAWKLVTIPDPGRIVAKTYEDVSQEHSRGIFYSIGPNRVALSPHKVTETSDAGS